MIKPVLCFALAYEAAPWLQQEGTKLKAVAKQIRLYEHRNFYVLITGIGIIKMATAIGWLQSVIQNPIHLVNIGVAASAKLLYQWHEVVKVTATYHNRAAYPELITINNLPKTGLLTVLQPADNSFVLQHDNQLIDMEGDAFINAAKHFLPVTHIHLLKFVSDNGVENLHDIETLKHQYISKADVAIEYVQQLTAFLNQNNTTAIFQQETLQQLIKHLRLTFTQEIQLQQAWQYASFYQLHDNIHKALQIFPKQIEHKAERNEYLQKIIATLYHV